MKRMKKMRNKINIYFLELIHQKIFIFDNKWYLIATRRSFYCMTESVSVLQTPYLFIYVAWNVFIALQHFIMLTAPDALLSRCNNKDVYAKWGNYKNILGSQISSEILWDPLRSSKILWDFLNSSEILWDPLISFEILWDPLRSSEIL